MKYARKPIALLLVLFLFLSLLPAGVFAADDAELTEEEEVLEVLPAEEETESPAEAEDVLPEEEVLPPKDGEDEAVQPEEPDNLDPMAGPEEEEDGGEEVEVQADPVEVEDEATGLKYAVANGKATVVGRNNSKLTANLVIPATLGGYPVTAIGNRAFQYNNITENLSIPESVTTIGDQAFRYCYKLTAVTIPEGVTTIGANAFERCDVLSVVSLSKSVKTIGKQAFYGCGSLIAIAVDPANSNFCDFEGVLFTKDKSTLLLCPAARTGTYVIPDGVKTIDQFAFRDCELLTGLTIPGSVTEIPQTAFNGCWALETVVLGSGLRKIGQSAFYYCSKLTGITIPDSVTEIGDNAFYGCKELETVVLGSGLRELGQCAFTDCSALKEITIPGSLTVIPDSAFRSCIALETVVLEPGVRTIGNGAFNYCKELKRVALPAGLTEICPYAFQSCGLLTDIAVPDSVTVINVYAFQGCSSLTAVEIPSGVIEIGYYAFQNCTALESVTLPEGLGAIEYNAFQNCIALTEIMIPDSVTSIGQYAFQYCSSLESVTLPAGVTAIEVGTFERCTSLESVTLPAGLTEIGPNAFYLCGSLTGVIIPEGVTEIREKAFYGCSELATVMLPNSVSYIASGVFGNCPNLETVYYFGTEEEADDIEIWGDNDALFDAEWIFEPEGDAPVLAFDREYIALKAGGEDVFLTVTTPSEIPAGAALVWAVDDEEVACIVDSGIDEEGCAQAWILTGDIAGTAWVTATLTTAAGTAVARCRIDVTADEVLPEVESVTLTEKKVTVEVFRTDYTRIAVIPNLSQNVFAAGLIEDYEVPEIEEGEYAVVKAEFVNPDAAGYFKLQVVDDRTLEIIPTEAALRDADAKDKALKGSYKTAVRVWIDDPESKPFETGALTLTVKKSLPAIKAKAVKLNSFINDVQPVVFTGGTVSKITALEGMPASGWLTRGQNDEAGELTLRYTGAILTAAPKSQKATLKLTVQAEGWAVDREVSVAVTAAPILPKVKLSAKTLTLNPKENSCSVIVGLSPAEYMTRPEIVGSFSDSYFTENGQKLPLNNDVINLNTLLYDDDDGNRKVLVSFRTGEGYGSAEKARTFKFYANIGGKEFPVTIKVLPASKLPAISVKAKGTIDTSIPNSPVTLEITRKNTGTIAPKRFDWLPDDAEYRIEILRGEEMEPVNTLTRYGNASSKLARITLTQNDLEAPGKPLDLNLGYKARVILKYGEAETDVSVAEVKIPVKSSNPNKVKLSVSGKATGKIDVLRPGSSILVTPKIKNAYGLRVDYDIYPEIIVVDKAGKASWPAYDLFTVEPNEDGTAFRVTLNYASAVDVKTCKYYIHLHVYDYEFGRDVKSKAIRLPIVMGKGKVTQSTKTLTMLKKDRNSSADFTLGVEDPTLRIVGVAIANDKQGLYKLTSLGGGRYAISCTDKMTAKTAKNTTLKLAVTFAGNYTGTPNTTVSMKVTWK